MSSRRGVPGKMRQYDTPDWTSLEQLLGSDELCGHFMWMYDVLMDDGTVLNVYKHRWTRCYLHLADDGRTFHYGIDDLYHEADPYTAIKGVFAKWACCNPTPEERRALRVALRKVRARPGPD